MKKYILFLFISIISLCFSEEIKIYKSATEFDYPPFSVTDKGIPDGFSVELLKSVAEEMDVKIEFKIDYWGTIKNELEYGKLDILPLVAYSQDRDKYFDFTVPYMVMHGGIFVRKDNDSIKTEKDLKEKETIVMKDDAAYEYALKNNISNKLILTKTYTDGFKLLSLGKYDALIIQNVVGLKIINDLKLKNIKQVTTIDEKTKVRVKAKLIGFEQKFCFAVKEGDKELLAKLNEGLAILVENGRYQELYNKWFPFMIDHTLSFKLIIMYLVSILIPILIIMTIFYLVMLKTEVKKKTFLLSKEIEERKIIEQKIIEEKNKAEFANNAKSEFLSKMSHEIRTPMNGIIGFTDIILETNLNKNQKEFIEIIKYSAESLLKIINEILDFSKVESGKIELEYIEFDLYDLIKKTISVILYGCKEKKINLSYNYDNDVGKKIIGDPNRLSQILVNILGNAIKFTNEGEISICVRKSKEMFVKDSSDYSIIDICIKDTGVGIPKNKIDTIFDTFTQADGSITRKYGGTGLGLSICKKLIELMGGKIAVESILGEGSSFTLTLPVKTSDKIGTLESEKSIEDNIDKKLEKKCYNGNVLIAEDNLINMLYSKNILSEMGFSVTEAYNGVEAFEKYKEKEFDLILMDIRMPEMDGYETSRKIREYEAGNKRIPIIALTADVVNLDNQEYQSYGIDFYLTKPFMKKDVTQLIENNFTLKRLDIYKTETISNDVVFDRDNFLKNIENDIDLYNKLISLFIKEFKKDLENLSLLIENSDFNGINQKLHSIKGRAQTIRAIRITNILNKIKDISEKEQNIDRLKNMFLILKDEFQNFIDEVSKK